ncbi:hypothetical protein PY650_10650 [Rhizobium calliandrae]|uniref:Exopeptide n=1 Tax=Rhizobium calliandrae TaxID=1312182 RepID=A0ABT7KBX6_9HYPH|nr:hypothetical protein [Rhizobium calliandrae]MDL2406119.1 hypothetical protein [Rhizobium calliandrae]
MRALLIIILALMVASVLSLVVIKPYVTGINSKDSTVAQKTIQQPEPKP